MLGVIGASVSEPTLVCAQCEFRLQSDDGRRSSVDAVQVARARAAGWPARATGYARLTRYSSDFDCGRDGYLTAATTAKYQRQRDQRRRRSAAETAEQRDEAPA